MKDISYDPENDVWEFTLTKAEQNKFHITDQTLTDGTADINGLMQLFFKEIGEDQDDSFTLEFYAEDGEFTICVTRIRIEEMEASINPHEYLTKYVEELCGGLPQTLSRWVVRFDSFDRVTKGAMCIKPQKATLVRHDNHYYLMGKGELPISLLDFGDEIVRTDAYPAYLMEQGKVILKKDTIATLKRLEEAKSITHH